MTWEPDGHGWKAAPSPVIEVSTLGGLGSWARGVDVLAVPTPGDAEQRAWERILTAVRPIPVHVVPRLEVSAPGGPWRAVAGASCGGLVMLSAEAMRANATLDPGGLRLLVHELAHEIWRVIPENEREPWEDHGDAIRAELLAWGWNPSSAILGHHLRPQEAEAEAFARWYVDAPAGSYELAPGATVLALWEAIRAGKWRGQGKEQ